MKKIVSLALSTAMALSMFASVTSAATLTTQEKYNALVTQGIFAGYPDGNAYLDKDMTRAEFAKVVALLTGLETSATGTNSYQDQNYANAWYKPYVEAVTKAGYMKGTTTGAKKLFNPNGKVTVQEMAATLVRAAKLEVPTTGINNTASAWAKGEVQAAINAGLISGTSNFTAAATRGLLVDTAYAYQTAVSAPTVASYEVSNNGSTVVFTLSNGEKVTVNLETPLVANQATDVKFTYDGREYTHSVTYTVTTATQVQGVAATNLKEIDVTFNGTVDEASAADVTNYNFSGGDIESAVLNGNVVRLTLEDGDEMVNQESYTLTVTGVKAGTATINSSAITFRPLDNVLPTVASVTGLGTKAVKVTFSEPVRNVNSGNFTLNGAAFNGSVTEGANAREYILRPYTAFPVGTHSLTSSLVEDYNGLRSLAATNEFTVAVDNTAPTATEVQGTLERVVVTFSEDIDPTTVVASDFYWMNGNTRVNATSVDQIAGNKFAVMFAGNSRLPASATTLYIDTVSDFSGNANTVKQYTVNATVDQTRPEVAAVSYNTNGTVTVRFNKSVTVERGDFTVTNSSGTVQPIRSVTAGVANNSYDINFYSTPASGTYTLAVSGVEDTTALRNTIVPYTTTFTVGDTSRPTFEGITANQADRTVTVSFNKAMDPATLTDRNNYALNFSSNGTATGSQLMALPSSVTLRTADNNRSVVLQFPARINGVDVTFPTATSTTGTVRGLTVTGVKDTNGNILADYTTGLQNIVVGNATLANYGSSYDTPARQTNQRTIQVRFSQSIDRVSARDFTLNGYTITSATANGAVVTLTTSADLGTDTDALDLRIATGNTIRTVGGNTVATADVNTPIDITDEVAPVITPANNAGTLAFNSATGAITVPFSEDLSNATVTTGGTTTPLGVLAATDVVVTNLSTNTALTANTQYTTSIVDGDLVIQLTTPTYAAEYSVRVINEARYLQDAEGNKVAASSTYQTTPRTGVAAPVVTAENAAGAVSNNAVVQGPVTVESTDAQNISTTTATRNGTAFTYQVGSPLTQEGEYVVYVTNNLGTNSTAITFTIDNTAPAVGTATSNAGRTAITIPVSDANLDIEAGAVVGYTVENTTTGTAVPVTATFAATSATQGTITLAPVTPGTFGVAGDTVTVTYTNAATGNTVSDEANNQIPTSSVTVTLP